MINIAGVDEAGRGPLIGPVVAAAVILPKDYDLPFLTDSKKLSERKREVLAQQIKASALAWHIAFVSAQQIDEINILQATLKAMTMAVDGLTMPPEHVLVDGNRLPKWDYSSEALVKGDLKEPAISAASILAKVARDSWMHELHDQHPEYQFANHKGYGTKAHLEAIKKYGILAEHRRSFKPVRERL